MVAREGIEPPTPGFSVRCSTNLASWPYLEEPRIKQARSRLVNEQSRNHPLTPSAAVLSRYFGTNSLGFSDPLPNKNFSISATRNARALGSIGVSRFSLISMVWCATHCAHASLEMLS